MWARVASETHVLQGAGGSVSAPWRFPLCLVFLGGVTRSMEAAAPLGVSRHLPVRELPVFLPTRPPGRRGAQPPASTTASAMGLPGLQD